MKRKLLSALLCLVMVLTLIPVSTAMAADPATTPADLTKTAVWTDTAKQNMQIALSSRDISEDRTPKVLMIGSLCNAHDLTKSTVTTTIEKIAEFADVEYHLFGNDNNLSNKVTVTDTLLKKNTALGRTGKLTTKQKNKINMAYPRHATIFEFAKVLEQVGKDEAKAGKKLYDYIVMEFDGMRMCYFEATVSSANANSLNAASDVLKKYYKNDEVMWIVPKKESGDWKMYNDRYYGKTGQYERNVKYMLKVLAPEDLGADYAIPSTALNKLPTLSARLNATGDNAIFINYEDASTVGTFVNNKLSKLRFSGVIMTDEVAEGFTIKSVTGQYKKDGTWTNMNAYTAPKFTYVIDKDNPQKVTGTFDVTTFAHTEVRMFINCSINAAKDPFAVEKADKDNNINVETNKGNAKADYYRGGVYEKSAEATPPALTKKVYTVTTTVTGGTTTTETLKSVEGGTVTSYYAPTNQYYDLTSVKINDIPLSGTTLTNAATSYKISNIAKDYTIDVVYTLPNVDVTFDSKGGSPVTKQTIAKGTKATKPANPTRAGYTFDKWTETPSGTIGYDFNTIVTANKTLYGQWIENEATFNYSATTGGNVSKTSETVKVETGTAAGSTASNSTGYHFVNWTDASGNEVSKNKTFTPSKNATTGFYESEDYTANFEINEYTVQFDEQGHGTAPDDQNVNHGEKATEPTALSEAGYTFGGWYKEPGCINKWNFATDTVTADTTLYAKWTENDATFNYSATTGGNVSKASETVKVKTGTAAGSTASNSTGYHFVNWTDASGNEVSKNATFKPSKNATTGLYESEDYTANFEINQYTFKFDKQGHGINPANQTVNHGAKATEPAALKAEGFTFGGWYEDAKCTKPYNFDTPVTKDVTVYAKWTEIVEDIHFDVNGGEPFENADQKASYTKEFDIFKYIPVRPGFTFLGWAISKEHADAGIVDFAPGDLYKKAKTIPHFATLYAVWKENPPPTGDSGFSTMWLVIMALAAAGFAATVLFRKKVFSK